MLLQATDHTVDSFGIIYIGGFRDLKGETKSVYLIGEDQFADLFDKDFRFFKMLGKCGNLPEAGRKISEATGRLFHKHNSPG